MPNSENVRNIKYGTIISDFSFTDNPKNIYESVKFWQKLVQEIGSLGIELQPELYNLHELANHLQIQQGHDFLGIHQPCHQKDIFSPDSLIASQSKQDTISSMNIAQNLKADYLVIHPVQKDNWENRNIQHEQAKIYLEELANYHQKHNHQYRLCLENLEYPKYPSSLNEMLELLTFLKEKGIEYGLIFDIAHDWHNLIHLFHQIPNTQLINENDYYQVLFDNLTRLTNQFGPNLIEGFHLAQAYISDSVHNTHGLPGFVDGQSLSANKSPKFVKPYNIKGPWLNIELVLKTIADWMKFSNIEETKIVLESHHRQESEIAKVALLLKQLEL